MRKLTSLILFLTLITAPSIQGADRRTPVVEAVEKARPAVLNIRTEEIVRRRSSSLFGFSDPFFNDFFGRFSQPRIYRTQSLGSGVIVDPRGYILTNFHVIEKASKIYIALPDSEKEQEARLVGQAEIIDLALLKIKNDKPFPFLSVSRHDDVMLGETVIAIGNPLGLGHSVTTGIISAARRHIEVEEGFSSVFIQTDALINPGNSGGPLLNINGELVGINTAIASQAQGIGFAIPVETINRVLDDLIEYGRVQKAYLGIYPAPVGEGFSRTRGHGGILISSIDKGSPADLAGLRFGDVILAMNSVPMGSVEELVSYLSTYTPGDSVGFRVLRGMNIVNTDVVLSNLPEGYGLRYAEKVFGLAVSEGGPRGVTVKAVRDGTTAAEIGISSGDIIAEVEGKSVNTVSEFSKVVESMMGREPLRFLLVRGSRGYYLELP